MGAIALDCDAELNTLFSNDLYCVDPALMCRLYGSMSDVVNALKTKICAGVWGYGYCFGRTMSCLSLHQELRQACDVAYTFGTLPKVSRRGIHARFASVAIRAYVGLLNSVQDRANISFASVTSVVRVGLFM